MLIDCDTCAGQGIHCGDCVVAMLLDSPLIDRDGGVPRPLELDGDEQIAFVSLAEAGLVPPLRLVPDRRAAHHPTHRGTRRGA